MANSHNPKTSTLSTNPDLLYALAFEYKKTKLWKLLYDSQLFAVQLTDGEIGYCCVMGMCGKHNAIAVYVGQDGIDSYRNISNEEYFDVIDADGHEMPSFQSHEKMMSQDCIQCAFEHKEDMRDASIILAKDYAKRNGIKLAGVYPDFVNYKPYLFPWYVRDIADQQHIAEALEAAIEVSRQIEADVSQYQKEIPSALTRDAREAVRLKLGFTYGTPYNRRVPFLEKAADGSFTWSSIALPKEKKKRYLSPKLDANDIILARIKKAKPYLNDKMQAGSWYCDVIMIPQPVNDEIKDDDVGMAGITNSDNNKLTELTEGNMFEPVEAPFFPLAMLAFDSESQVLVSMAFINKLDAKGYTTIIRTLAESIVDIGKPRSFLVKENDRRTNKILHAFSEQIGVEIEACDDDDYDLLDAEMNMLEYMSDENDTISDDGFQKQMDEIAEQLMSISDAELRKMPSELRNVLFSEADAGHLDKELVKRLNRIFDGR